MNSTQEGMPAHHYDPSVRTRTSAGRHPVVFMYSLKNMKEEETRHYYLGLIQNYCNGTEFISDMTVLILLSHFSLPVL